MDGDGFKELEEHPDLTMTVLTALKGCEIRAPSQVRVTGVVAASTAKDAAAAIE